MTAVFTSKSSNAMKRCTVGGKENAESFLLNVNPTTGKTLWKHNRP